ncbi:methylamine utilization protein MauG [Mameliella alba]|nr:methylamine utilization protein MauG [Antarctobacter heliothermus]MBY6143042.1 methylamine utilization protein MauG [Mameliella alba]MCA0953234.1 methylamine utilization protein MauG [Mameliella alba]
MFRKLFPHTARLSAPATLAAALAAAAPPAFADMIDPQDFLQFDQQQAQLGRLLFYDKLLSGNQNISCATCHHHSLHGADGISLGIGEGGAGLGTERTPGDGTARIEARVPRNAPALWNLGHREVRELFHDGRVERIGAGYVAFKTPAKEYTPAGLNSLLAAQALFPVSSAVEMAGHPDENPVSAAFAERIDLGWAMLADRVRDVPEYEALFTDAFPEVRDGGDITIVQIANAIAAFIGTEWQSHDSPYDKWLSDGTPMPPMAERGRQLFFGEAGCSGCHNGPRFTDQAFYAVGVPQFGPGRPFGDDTMPHDLGRMETTRNPDDAYKFRTPSLRNVALTAPYGHNGAYPTLRDMIRHMCDPLTARNEWTPRMARLPDVSWLNDGDFTLVSDPLETAQQISYLDISPVQMVDADIDALEAFLNALTGETAEKRPMGRPDAVPSGLPVD